MATGEFMFLNRAFRPFLFVILLCGPIARAEEAAPKLFFQLLDRGLDNPLYFTHDPAGRNFVVEKGGIVWLFEDGKRLKQPYLDVVDRVHKDGECGFLSIAFHPDFEKNGRLFVNYTSRKPKLHTVISEFKADPKAETVDASTEKLVLSIDQPQGNHNGGLVMFGPDRMLYIGMGDGGAGGDRGGGHYEPGGNGQYPGTLLGKILRIDVDSAVPYGIPKDNPFVTDKAYRPEIWCLGMRNPWRFSFDRETKTMYCGDVGQNKYEEIDIITKGGNYGWRIREGLHAFSNEKSQQTLIEPVAEYDRQWGQSVTGGYVYRGKKFPELQGMYLYADFASGRFWGLRYENGKVTWNRELETVIGNKTGPNRISISSFGEDLDGELYACDHDRGMVYQITVQK
jgi:glucose/arabinose dehydrogenase